MTMTDKFERLSGFYQTKKEWNKKECTFQLMTMKKGKPKVVTETKFDMSALIGDIMITIIIDMGQGYMLHTKWNVLPACPKLHAALFAVMSAEENREADANGPQR